MRTKPLQASSSGLLKINKEYLDLVPRLSHEQYVSLKNSISEDGQQVSIIINQDGVILDGHTRFQVCQELKIKPKFTIKEFDDPAKEREFVVTANLARRHLSVFQRAEVCYNFYKDERDTRYQRAGKKTWEVRRGEREAIPEGPEKRASRLLNRFGVMIGSSATKCHQMIWLIENADESMKQILRTDQITVQQAYRSLKNPNWKPRIQYGKYFRYSTCLMCDSRIKDPKETGCHVHTGGCCSECRWGY